MDGKRVITFFGVFSLIVLVAVLVSAVDPKFTIREALAEQGVFGLEEQQDIVRDLQASGYDLDWPEFTMIQFRQITDGMKEESEENGNYDADWSRVDKEVGCLIDFYLNREPGEIFELQGNKIISYCLPSGQAPWAPYYPDEKFSLTVEGASGSGLLGFSDIGGGILLGGDGPGGSDDDWETNEDGTACTPVKKGWLTNSKPPAQCSKTCADNQGQCIQCCVNSFKGSGQSYDKDECQNECREAWIDR